LGLILFEGRVVARKKDLLKQATPKSSAQRRWKDLQPKSEAPQPLASRRWLVQGSLLVLIVAGSLAAVIVLGQWGLEEIRGKERYAVPFASIECAAPPGLTRAEFLDEVQYLSRLPDRLGLLDDDLVRTLRTAFARHPWVERVDGVVLEPPRQVRVSLVIRQPVLAVPTSEGVIAVDAHGVRLPKNASMAGLPIFEGDARPPLGPAGTKWGDAKVEERARQEKKL
jgi:hypothetical protein